MKYDVVLTTFGKEKIKVIKAVRELTGHGLAESMVLVEGVPSMLKASVAKEEAESINATLTNAGATVAISKV